MILRHPLLDRLPLVFMLLASTLLQARADSFDCKPLLEGKRYDFTSLGKEHQVNRTRSTPPSTTIDSLTFNLCADLVPKEGVADHDRCPFGTRACLTQVNIKGDDERIISVVPLAETSKLAPKLTVNSSPPKRLNLTLHGPDYPEKSTDTTPSVPQSFKLTLWCEPDEDTKMSIKKYDGSELELEYFGKAGCPVKSEDGGGDTDIPNDGDKDGDSKDEEHAGSGIGWFFLMLLLVFLAYFGIGAYYNYSTYGARGLDLIPHRDFWQEVPYMLRDVVSHLCSSAKPRSRSSRNGYIQV